MLGWVPRAASWLSLAATLVLTACGGEPPTIVAFSASGYELQYEIENATSMKIDFTPPSVGGHTEIALPDDRPSGHIMLIFKLQATTVFTLSATNDEGTSTAQVTIEP